MMSCAFISIFYLLFLSYGANAYKVSFFGDSYISMPLQEAKLSTNVRLKFKTRQENGLIFATAGRLDSCVLQMFSGRLRLSMNIGAHPVELSSPEEYFLNDAEWHDVYILRYETNITFQIDTHFVRHFIPPDIGKLNIHFGIYIGGLGDFSITNVIDEAYFRGCISDVYYNNISILKRAKDNVSHIIVEHVSWICEDEFDADEYQPVSFLESDSYALIRSQQNTGNYGFDFKTAQQNAPLMMSLTGQDLLLLEISNGIVKLISGNAHTKFEVFTDVEVSDGHWHSLSVKDTFSMIEVTIDNITYYKNHSFIFNGKHTNMYFGGIPIEVRKKLKIIQNTYSDYALKGCMQNLYLNGLRRGFPDFKVTRHVKNECSWQFPCLEKQPCILSGKCIQKFTNKFTCQCDQLYCIRADFRESYSLFSSSEEIIEVNPVYLSEGDSVYLTDANIAIPFDYGYYKMTEHSIHFTVVQLPKHGTIVKVIGESNYNTKNFSYYDILQTNIKYVHNGKEEHLDQMTLDMMFETDNQYIDSFSDGHRFVLHFNITPVNDPPHLSFAKNTIFRLVENIAELFTTEYVQLEDSDSPPDTLIYKVISPKHKIVNGNFEIDDQIVDTFSHKDVLDKRVYYIIRQQIVDDKRFEVFLEVSDGVKTSPIVALPVLVKPLQLKLVNNTGLIMSHSLTMKISNFNLSFAANSLNNSFDIHYNIIAQPQSGVIEKKRMIDSTWTEVKYFTNRQLNSGQIRYRHTVGSPIQDEFKFIVKCFSFVSQIYDFRIRFVQFEINPVYFRPLKIKGEKQSLIDSSILLHQTLPENIMASQIIYRITSVPKYGYISVSEHTKVC